MSKRDLMGTALAWVSGLGGLGICGLILGFLVVKGGPALSWDFVSQDPRPSLQEALSGGILTPIIGTALLTLLGVALAFPWSFGSAVYLAEYAREGRLLNLVRTGIEVLAGVPTVVFGLFALALFSHPSLALFSSMVEGVEGGRAFGRSFLVCAAAMAVMVLPYAIKCMEEALRAVPPGYREAAYALGLTKWRTIRKVVVPAAMPGIITGVILAVGRIAGDTAIVWLCLGGSMTLTGPEPWWHPQNWLETLRSTGSTLTSYIYYSSPAGEGNSPTKAFGAGLVLMAMVLVLNFIVDYLGRLARAREE
ncbi:MAG: phosphate ABC transporter permease PstA [Clostridia bacterium]|nr:phosphate ABC transporter permease PstA [Clostridia bacterium]MDH7573951.1 phosphate ABC transporter permease PstA [Clostridia bacterium]